MCLANRWLTSPPLMNFDWNLLKMLVRLELMMMMMMMMMMIVGILELTSPLLRRESTHNQVTGYELTSPLWVRVDFLGTGSPGYGSVRLRVDLIIKK